MGTKFNIDRKPVPDEEINSHKDFGELVNKFKKQSIEKARGDSNFLKNKKATYSTIIAGVAVICTVTYFSVLKKEPTKEIAHDKIITKQNSDKNTPSNKLKKAFIAPPISKLNVPYTSYKIKAEQGAIIKHQSHSKIIIPKKAFVDKQGHDIVGDVEIKYREFHNQADIIVSGIPMTYDSAGVKTHLESAGMFDIKGYQNGEPISINPNKQITIEFASEYPNDRYNLYELDTIAKNWNYLERDNSLKKSPINAVYHTLSKTESPNAKELQNKIDLIPPKIELEKTVYSKKLNQLPKITEPTKPTKAIVGRPQFELEVDYKEFPELAAFKNAVFEVGSKNKNYNSKLADITWGSAEISEGPQKGKNYLLTLKLRERVEKLIVYPALTAANYDNALKSYELKFTDYKNLVVKREANEKRLKEEFEAKQSQYLTEMKQLEEKKIQENIKLWKEQESKQNEQFRSIDNQEKVVRVFQISKFGTYNSDCPTFLPDGATINPKFVLNHSETKINPHTIYLICHSKNLVYNLQNNSITYNPDETYSLCVLAKGKLYLCSKEEFHRITTSKEHEIRLTELSDEVNDANDLKKAMGI